MKKTEIILREDGSIYKEVDYLDDLALRLAIVKGEITEQLFYKNEYGGMSKIDAYSCCEDYQTFEIVGNLLSELVRAQCKLRGRTYKEQMELRKLEK